MNRINGEAAFGSMNRGPKEILFPKRAKSSIHNGSAQERERLEQERIDDDKPIDWAAVAQWGKEQPLIVDTDPPSDEMPAWVRGPSWTEILAMSNLTPQDYWNAILEAKRLGLKISACANLISWRSELDAANLSPYACRVLCELSKRANGKEDGAFPSYTTIEKACGISRPTVRRALRELELAGLIRVKRTWGKQNRYTVVSLEEWLEWRTAKGLLCSMILSPDVLLECASRIAAEFFCVPAHRIIFSTLRDLAAENEPADFALLKVELARSKQLEEIGGVEYLSDLWNFVPTSANWKFYASLLGEFYRRRTTIIECQRLIEKMYDLQGSLYEQITEGVETALTKLALYLVQVEKPFRQLVAETIAEIDRRAKGEGSTGIRFGLDSLDAQLGEVRPGEVCIISAQTSGGKTALALQAVLEHAASGYSVALFSFEMRATQMIERALAHDGNISMKTICSGKLSMIELGRLDASVERLSERAIFIMENTGCDINQIVSRCRYLKVRYALTLVVVDYLQLVQPGASRNDATREREVADISRKLKAMALELNVPVLALSQLNDQGRLRESRAIGQDADIVLRIDDSKSDNSFAVDIVIDKHRSGARDKRVTVEFVAEFMRFQDLRK